MIKRKKQRCHYNTIKHGISLSVSKIAGVENPKSHKVPIHVFHSGNRFFPPMYSSLDVTSNVKTIKKKTEKSAKKTAWTIKFK